MLFSQFYYNRQKHILDNANPESLCAICTDGAYFRAIRDTERRKDWYLYLKIEKAQKKLLDLYNKTNK